MKEIKVINKTILKYYIKIFIKKVIKIHDKNL